MAALRYPRDGNRTKSNSVSALRQPRRNDCLLDSHPASSAIPIEKRSAQAPCVAPLPFEQKSTTSEPPGMAALRNKPHPTTASPSKHRLSDGKSHFFAFHGSKSALPSERRSNIPNKSLRKRNRPSSRKDKYRILYRTLELIIESNNTEFNACFSIIYTILHQQHSNNFESGST